MRLARLKRRSPRRALLFIACVTTLVGGGIFAAATRLSAQRRFYIEPNAVYDGRYTFVRLSYTVYGRSGWEFDYPAMERNFMTILKDLTTIKLHSARATSTRWTTPSCSSTPSRISRSPAIGTRARARRRDCAAGWRKAAFSSSTISISASGTTSSGRCTWCCPSAQLVRLTVTHPIFDSFFQIKTLEGMTHPDNANAKAEYYGIYENNDPTRRLMVIVNYNNDIGDYMEWSGDGWYPVNMSNDAYKLATNYIVYAMTH